MDVTGLGSVAIGLVLCFFGARSVHLAVLTSGFALGWLLADAFDATPLASIAFGIVAGVAAWALARLVFGLALFVIGALARRVVGAKLFAFLQQGQTSIVLATLFVLAFAFIAGVATRRFRSVVLAIVCAAGGAGLALNGLARTFPQPLGWLRSPASPGTAALAALIWIALAAVGWAVQRRTTSPTDHSRGHP